MSHYKSSKTRRISDFLHIKKLKIIISGSGLNKCGSETLLSGLSLTGILPVFRSNSNIKRLPLGSPTSKGSMNVDCMMCETVVYLLLRSHSRRMGLAVRMRLAVRTTSIYRSCNDSPCRRCHSAKRSSTGLCSCHKKIAIGQYLGPQCQA